MKNKEERIYEKVETAELLNFIGIELDYSDDNEVLHKKQRAYNNELELRAPFSHIKQVIDRIDDRLRKLESAVSKMIEHEHGENGEPVIKIKKEVDNRFW